jgi:hypothetical protein
VRTWLTVGLVAAAGGLGFYLGAKYAVGEVQTGAVGAFDSILGAVGVNVNQGYGRTAHNIADAVAGQILQ